MMDNNLLPRSLKIVDIYDDGRDALHFEFQIMDYTEPGLQKRVCEKIEPGQFFMLSLPGAGEAPFTYVSKPDAEGRFFSLIRSVGVLTEGLKQCQKGQMLGYRGPLGRGWPRFEANSLAITNTLVIAGGCGLAPLAWWLSEHKHHSDAVALLYGAQDKASQVLHQEVKQLKQTLKVFEMFDEAESGYLQGNPLNLLDEVVGQWGRQPDRILMCGPESMMFSLAKTLQYNGVPEANIWLSLERRMHCGTGTCGHCYIANTYLCKDGPVYSWSELSQIFRRTTHFEDVEYSIRHC